MSSTSLLVVQGAVDDSAAAPSDQGDDVAEKHDDATAPTRKRPSEVGNNDHSSSKSRKKDLNDSIGLVDTTISEPPNGLANGEADNETNVDGLSSNTRPKSIARLSKWAARLFDPDRPKGLVQAPQTIPLNDEFLLAFGRREKATSRVQALDIQRKIDDDDEEDDDDDNNTGTNSSSDNAATPVVPESLENKDSSGPGAVAPRNRKVKITNLLYATTAATLEAACSAFGTIESTKLIMQKEDTTKNTGAAYVIFVTAASALACIQGLTSIDNRPVKVTSAARNNSTTPGGKSASNSAASSSRYYGTSRLVELSTKCFQCGQAGHMASSCPNDAKVKPCPLCAQTDHEMRNCPSRQVCFNCGIPGHVSRSCPIPRNARPERRFCTVCYVSFSHNRWNCPHFMGRHGGGGGRSGRGGHATMVTPPDTDSAICATCGNTGHYQCRKLQWNSNLQGVWCGRCGMPGHIGAHCNRPNLEICSRNDDVVCLEIERAGSITTAEHHLPWNGDAPSSFDDSNRRRHASQGRPHQRGDGGGGGGHGNNRERDQQHGGGYDRPAYSHHAASSNRNNSNNSRNSSAPQHERGRSPYRRESSQQQPQFRPFKSVPPPPPSRHKGRR